MTMNMGTRESQCQRLPVFLLLGCLLGGATVAWGQTAETDIRRDATVVAVEKVMPSVVNIATETIIHVRDDFDEFFSLFWGPYHRRQPPNSQWGYALEACATDQPTGFGRFSLVRRRYRRHLHRPFMFYLISLGS